MSSFTTPLIVEFLGANRWRLAESFEYHLGELGSGVVIRVPAGFETDFASVPRLLWPLLPPTGSYGKAAVLHDYLYATQQIAGQSITRAKADEVFLEAMAVLGVGWLKRHTVYWGVRLGGWLAWNQHRRHLQHATKSAS